MLRVWNMTLVIMTFFLTIFGTFMTRSGIVQSVHAFGQDETLMWMFMVFMIVLLVFSLRPPHLPVAAPAGSNELESWVSREAAFSREQLDPAVLGVLRAVRDDVPDLSEAVTGMRLTVGPPFSRSGCCRSGSSC